MKKIIVWILFFGFLFLLPLGVYAKDKDTLLDMRVTGRVTSCWAANYLVIYECSVNLNIENAVKIKYNCKKVLIKDLQFIRD